MNVITDILLLVGSLLVVVAAAQPLAARLALPESTLLSLIAIAFGLGYAALASRVAPGTQQLVGALIAPRLPAEAYIAIFLPPLLFEAALTVDLRGMLRDLAPILMLAVVAVFVATGAIGVALAAVSDYGLAACLLLGAVVATTDPAAVIAVFRDVGAPPRLVRLVEGESLLNDAAAIAIVGVLTGVLGGLGSQHAMLGAGLWRLLLALLGGALCGGLAGRAAAGLFGLLRRMPLAECALTLALPYPLFLGANAMGISGVVAVVCAGLSVNTFGRTRLIPQNWRHLKMFWAQVASLAGAMVFLLAMVRAPALLAGMDLRDLAWLGVLAAAALASRFAVVYLLLPPLNWLRLSEPVSAAYKTAIAWGGLRGAVTLVLALSIAEDVGLDASVRHFVAVLATSFVLLTLLVNGTTLRALLHWLRLDRLSPQEQALQRQILEVRMVESERTVERLAGVFGIAPAVADAVRMEYRERINARIAAMGGGEGVSERDWLRIGLVILATHERDLVTEYGNGVIATRNLDAMMRNAGQMIDAAREHGRVAYIQAAKRVLGEHPRYRLGEWLHRHAGWDRLLVKELTDRFELANCRRAVLERLRLYNREMLAPVLGERLCGVLAEILDRRVAAVDEVTVRLRERYATYTAALERRMLTLYMLNRGRRSLEELYAGHVISREVYEHMSASLESNWRRVIRQPSLRAPFAARGQEPAADARDKPPEL